MTAALSKHDNEKVSRAMSFPKLGHSRPLLAFSSNKCYSR